MGGARAPELLLPLPFAALTKSGPTWTETDQEVETVVVCVMEPVIASQGWRTRREGVSRVLRLSGKRHRLTWAAQRTSCAVRIATNDLPRVSLVEMDRSLGCRGRGRVGELAQGTRWILAALRLTGAAV